MPTTRPSSRSPQQIREARARGGKLGGRPRRRISWRRVVLLAERGFTRREVAAEVGVSLRTLTGPLRREVFARSYRLGCLRASVAIRAVLIQTLRGRLVNPLTGEAELVPMRLRISVAKYLGTRPDYLDLDGKRGWAGSRNGSRLMGQRSHHVHQHNSGTLGPSCSSNTSAHHPLPKDHNPGTSRLRTIQRRNAGRRLGRTRP